MNDSFVLNAIICRFVYVYFSSFQSRGTFCVYVSQRQKCYLVFLAPYEQEPMGNVISALNEIKVLCCQDQFFQ
jgi:hypothetical protein